MSKSVLLTLYRVKKCLIDSLSVLFEVAPVTVSSVDLSDAYNYSQMATKHQEAVPEVAESARACSYFKLGGTENTSILDVNVLAVNFSIIIFGC